jgi:capsular polysaccharide biosynthesis protein
MDNEIRTEDEISLADIFSCLLSKLRLLIVLFLVGLVAGGAFGFLKSYDVVYYGTEMSFFVSPEKASGGTGDDTNTNVIYGTYGNTVMDTMIKFLSTEKAAEEFVADMEFEGLPKKPDPKAEPAEYTAQVKAYNKMIDKVQKSLSFTYSSQTTADKQIALDIESKNFIYVELEVKEEGIYTKEFTAELLRQLQVKIPKIVKATMLNPDENKYVTTGCTLVTPLYPIVECMNETYALTETIKFAALVGLATLLVACIVVVVVERLDKRVKEVESIEKKFSLPVLGVIPSILSQTETDKRGNE